jgi:hypothetical protein
MRARGHEITSHSGCFPVWLADEKESAQGLGKYLAIMLFLALM